VRGGAIPSTANEILQLYTLDSYKVAVCNSIECLLTLGPTKLSEGGLGSQLLTCFSGRRHSTALLPRSQVHQGLY